MTRFFMFLAMGLLASPTLALAVEHNAGYRGIGYIYFSFIAAVLLSGVYDAFGKTASCDDTDHPGGSLSDVAARLEGQATCITGPVTNHPTISSLCGNRLATV